MPPRIARASRIMEGGKYFDRDGKPNVQGSGQQVLKNKVVFLLIRLTLVRGTSELRAKVAPNDI